MTSRTKEKGSSGLGLQSGGESIHMELEKQIFGKQMFAGPFLPMKLREDFGQMAYILKRKGERGSKKRGGCLVGRWCVCALSENSN